MSTNKVNIGFACHLVDRYNTKFKKNNIAPSHNEKKPTQTGQAFPLSFYNTLLFKPNLFQPLMANHNGFHGRFIKGGILLYEVVFHAG